MEFFVEAHLLCHECAGMSAEDLIAKFRSKKQPWEFHNERIKEEVERTQGAIRAQWQDTLELDPGKSTDPARAYLTEQGLHLKKAGAVLNNVREAWETRPADLILGSADALIAHCRSFSDGETIYKIPRFLLRAAADRANQRRKQTKLANWKKTGNKKAGNKNFKKSSV
jgi:hypothetical protein